MAKAKFERTPEYNSWRGSKERCFNPNNNQYKSYGAIGITMYEGWIHDFNSFLAYMGPKPSDGNKYSLGRIDNTKGYFPGNVRWETEDQQARNKGMLSNNNSGHNGVSIYTYEKNGNFYENIRATVTIDKNKRICRSWAVVKYGKEAAISLAVAWREEMLLSANGAGYAEKHGTKKGNPYGNQ